MILRLLKVNILSKSLEQKLIGAISVNVTLQKAVTGIKDGEVDEWGDLYKGLLRTNGNGSVEYEAFLNGPGIYKLILKSGRWQVTRHFYVAGKGKTQYPLGVDKDLQIILEKAEFNIDDNAEIFIPNPYNSPAIALLTVERESVLFHDVMVIPDSFLLYTLPIKKDYGPDAFISLMLVNQEQNQEYKFGLKQINIDLENKKLNITTEFTHQFIDDQNTASVDITVKDNTGQPVISEIFLQSIRSNLRPGDMQSTIFEKFYHFRPITVVSNYSGFETFGDVPGNNFENRELLSEEKNNTSQTLWTQKVQTDRNGHAVVNFPYPYDSQNLWLKLYAVTDDLKIGNLVKSIPPGFTASIIPHIPQNVNRGDKFQLGLSVTNLLDFPQTFDVNLELQNLVLTGEKSSQITIGVDETKEITWQVTAPKAGQETINISLTNPAGETILVTQSQEVIEFPVSTQTLINGYFANAGQQDSYFGFSKNKNFVDGLITTYMIPDLSSSLMTGIKNFSNESLTIEQKVWSLLAFVHLQKVIQASGIEEPVLMEKIRKHIQDLGQSLMLLQNQDGGWPKIRGNQSDPYLTSYCAWGLKLSETIINIGNNQYLDSTLEYLLVNLNNPDSTIETISYDKLAILYFAINILDNERVNLSDLIPYLPLMTNEGKIFLGIALEMNNRGDDQARRIVKEIEKSIKITDSNFTIKDDQFSQDYFKSETSQIALTIYALSTIDPANIDLNQAIPKLMNLQKSPGQWDSVMETSLCMMALSMYLQGRGMENGKYEYDAYINNIHVINGVNDSINFLPPTSNLTKIENNGSDLLFDLRVNRTEGPGTLYYLTKASFLELPDKIAALDSGFAIKRYFSIPENENDMTDCYLDLCFGDSLTAAKSSNEKIQVILVITTSKNQQNVFIEENIPAGMVLIRKFSQVFLINDDMYRPLIKMSENYVKYQGHAKNSINWFAEEIPAGTYVLSYYLLPEFVGQFSIPPAQVWARFSTSNPSRSNGQMFTIINR